MGFSTTRASVLPILGSLTGGETILVISSGILYKATIADIVALVSGIPSLSAIILDDDVRLSVSGGIYTLDWDTALQNQFGFGEATVKVLFDNGSGGFDEQKSLVPTYNYTGSAVSSISLPVMVAVTFKIIITP